MKARVTTAPLILFFFFLCGDYIYAQFVPAFLPGERIKFSDGTDLVPGTGNVIAVPCVVDWNNDGKKDLLGGYFYNGNIYRFINVGSNSQPSFIHGNEMKVMADGTPISVAYG